MMIVEESRNEKESWFVAISPWFEEEMEQERRTEYRAPSLHFSIF
jgi:hypothetical protein